MTSLVAARAAGILPDGGEARVAVAQQRQQPFRPHRHLVHHAQVRAEFAPQAGVAFARARGAHRHVDGERQRFDARRRRALDDVEADGVIVLEKTIELQPKHVGRDFGDVLDGCAAGDAERVGHARALRRLRHQEIGARPHQRRAAHRRDADRRCIARAEQFHLGRRHRGDGAVARHHLDGVEGRPIVRDADVGAGAGVAIFEREARHVLGRARAQISRTRVLPMQRLEIRADPLGEVPDCFFIRHVVHDVSRSRFLIIPRPRALRPGDFRSG